MYEIEIKSLLGSKERADALRAKLKKRDPAFTLVSHGKQRNHYWHAPGDLSVFEKIVAPLLSKDKQEKLSDLIKGVNPVRSSRGAVNPFRDLSLNGINPAFAEELRHSSPRQAVGHSASNGVKGEP